MDLRVLGLSEAQLLLNIFLAFGLGAIVGLRNEITHAGKKHKTMLGGFRTYGMGAVLFYILGLTGSVSWIFVGILAGAVAILTIAFYVQHLTHFHTKSMSMELSFILTVLLAFLWGSGLFSYKLALTVAVLISFLMAYKSSFKNVFLGFNEAELKEILLFFVLVIVLLPWVPTAGYSIYEVLGYLGIELGDLGTWAHIKWINLHSVILIMSVFVLVELLGHIAGKFIDKTKALVWESIIGGFMSSTTATVSIARSVFGKKLDIRLGGYAIVLATVVSFVQILLLIMPFGARVFLACFYILWPILLVGVGLLWYLSAIVAGRNIKELAHGQTIENRLVEDSTRQVVDVYSAFRFGVLVVVLRFILELIRLYVGDKFFIFSILFLGFTGIDVATLSIVDMVKTNIIGVKDGIALFIGVNIVNLLAKLWYLYWFNRKEKGINHLVFTVAVGYVVIILTMVVGYALM